jgi:hypothetical protein
MTLSEQYDSYGFSAEEQQSDLPEGFTGVIIGIPGKEHGVWGLRESLSLGALAVVTGGLTMLVVQRRRP